MRVIREAMRAACGLSLALAGAVGCEAIADLDRFQPPSAGSGGAGAAGSAGASSTSGGAPACGVSDSCVPEPPSGWTAIHLFPGPRPEGCSAPTAGGLDVTAEASTCPQCSCAPAEGGTCGAVPITLLWDGSSCGGSPSCTEMNSVTAGSCLSTLICNGPPAYANGVVIDSIPASGAMCQSTTIGAPDHPPPTFVDEHTACAIEGTPVGCAAGALCVPNPPGGFIPRYCVSSPTEVERCPIEYPHERMVLYTDHDDTRTCSACGCASPTGQVCPGTATRFPSGGCASGTGFALGYTPGNCAGLTSVQSIRVDAGPPGGGTCTETGGAVEGGVAATSPLKICCTQP